MLHCRACMPAVPNLWVATPRGVAIDFHWGGHWSSDIKKIPCTIAHPQCSPLSLLKFWFSPPLPSLGQKQLPQTFACSLIILVCRRELSETILMCRIPWKVEKHWYRRLVRAWTLRCVCSLRGHARCLVSVCFLHYLSVSHQFGQGRTKGKGIKGWEIQWNSLT